jgi:hypothetical protein
LDEESRERQAEILAAIEAWQETHPAEAPEDDGDDCGYDDVGD